MKVVSYFFKNQTLTWALFLILMILGIVGFTKISRREDPDLQGRAFQVIIEYPGATAKEVEKLVGDKVERALLELDDIESVETTSKANVCVIRTETSDKATDLENYKKKFRARIDDIRSQLPKEVTRIEINDRFTDTAAMIIAVTKPGASPRELEDYATKIRTQLRRSEEISNIDLLGQLQEKISVNLDPNRLAQFQLDLNQLRAAIGAKNVLPSTGGSVDMSGSRLEFRGSGMVESISEIGSIPIGTSAGATVYLRDVATISQSFEDPAPSLMRVNGERAVGVSLTMRKGYDITKVGDHVEAELAKIKQQLPDASQIHVVNDLPTSVKGRIGEFSENLITGAVLIAFITFLFMGWRSATIVALSLPITIIGVFLMMWLLGRDIQQISVAALIISLGLVVDNSVVVIDNIEKKLAAGINRAEAAKTGTLELFGPLVASNLTTVGAFGPLALLQGGVGDFIRDLGLLTTVSTLVSLAFNLTVIPLIAGFILRVESGEKLGRIQRVTYSIFDRLRDGILVVSNAGLRRAGMTFAIAIFALLGSITMIPRLNQQFFPGALRNQFGIDIWTPEGTSIAETERVAAKVEALLKADKETRSFTTYVGASSPRFYYNYNPETPTSCYAQIVVNTQSIESTSRMIPELQKKVTADIPGATILVKKLAQGPPVGAPIAIRLRGSNINDLRASAKQVMDVFRNTPGAGMFYDDYHEDQLISKTIIDEDRAQAAGVSPAQAIQFANLAYAGQTVSYYREGDREIPISLQATPTERDSKGSIENLYIPSSNGSAVRLGDISSQTLGAEESRIVRRNNSRTLTVFGYADGSRTDLAVFADGWSKIKDLKLAGDTTVSYAGDKKESEKSTGNIGAVAILGVGMNILVVAWLFPNWRIVSAVMLGTPLSLIGGVFGLWIANQPFGFMAIQGIVALGGVVTNHTIVLFEYALQEQKNGLSLQDALVAAGSKRFRPIMLTVLLSIMGLIPQAVNGGSLWPPLAYTLIYGLVVSLLITLVVIPAYYSLISRSSKNQDAVTA